MKHILTLSLLFTLLLPALVSARECNRPNLVGLFIRLAEPHFVPTNNDSEIVGGFWNSLKSLKDAAHRGDASLAAYAADSHSWATGYGTADELWGTLNCSDYHLRETLRKILAEYRSREVSPDPHRFLAAQTRCRLGRDLTSCGCAP